MNPTKMILSLPSFIQIAQKHEAQGIFKSKAANGVVTLATLVPFKPNAVQATCILDGYSQDPILGERTEDNSPNYPSKPVWKLNSYLELERTVANKSDVAAVLTQLGLPKDKLATLARVKTTEFNEFIDASSMERDGDKEFAQQIKMKGFREGMEINHPLAKMAVIRTSKMHGQQQYVVSLPFADVLANLNAKADIELARTKIEIYNGFVQS